MYGGCRTEQLNNVNKIDVNHKNRGSTEFTDHFTLSECKFKEDLKVHSLKNTFHLLLFQFSEREKINVFVNR